MGNESNAVVRRVDLAASLSPTDRIKALLFGAGFPSVAVWARSRGFSEGAVWHAIKGRRQNFKQTKQILAALAEDVRKSLTVIQALVAGEQPPEDRPDTLEVSHGGGEPDAAAGSESRTPDPESVRK